MPYPSYDPGDQVYVTGSAAGGGLQAWADSWALSVGSTPVRAAAFYLGVRARDNTLDTTPAGLFAQTLRKADGKRFGGGGAGSLTGPNHFWSNMIEGHTSAAPGGDGLTIWVTFWPVGIGADHSPPPSNTWPDGSLVASGAPADSLGAIIVLANCDAAPGNGNGYETVVPGRSPLVGGAGTLYGFQWLLDFAISTSDGCGGGIGPPPPPPIPIIADGGVDLLYWREGYHIATAGNSGVGVSTKWHWDSRESASSAVIDGGPARCPKLSHRREGPPLGLLYSRGQGKDAAIYRQESFDYGVTWAWDPGFNVAFMKGPNGLSYADECWNDRTGERVSFYNDQSQLDAAGAPTGKGNIFCDVYGPELEPGTGRPKRNAAGPFRVTPAGHLADNSSFGVIYIASAGLIHCCVFVEGSNRTFQSSDDGRTWQDVT